MSKNSLTRFFRKRKCLVFVVSVCFFYVLYQLVIANLITSSEAEWEKVKLRVAQQKLTQVITSEADKNKIPKIDNTKDNHKPSLLNKPKITFKCLTGNMVIPYEYFNDDYCDCDDGSDEPATNACIQSRFVCPVRSYYNKQSIPSWMVNDGVCDCCDGADEWLNLKLPIPQNVYIQFSDNPPSVHRAPCVNRC